MKLSVCFLCGKPYLHEEKTCKVDEVYFSDYQPHNKPALTAPDGLECFCGEHINAAQALAHLTSKEALLELQKQYTCFPKYKYPPIKFYWWDRLFFRIFKIKVHQK